MPDVLAVLAIGFGSLGLAVPAFVARGIRRAEMQTRAIVRNRSFARSDVEPSTYGVRLARLLGGWGVLLGLVETRPPSVQLWIGVGFYAAVFFAGLGHLVFLSSGTQAGVTTVR